MDICVDPKQSIETNGGEAEVESHVGSAGSAEDTEEGEEGHGGGDEGLLVERVGEVEGSSRASMTIVAQSESPLSY